MTKFIQLAEAQNDHTINFQFISRRGIRFNMEISVCSHIVAIRRNNESIGGVEYDLKTDACVIYAFNSMLKRKWIQLFIEETNREDESMTAPAWKKRIIELYQKREEAAHLALESTIEKLSTI